MGKKIYFKHGTMGSGKSLDMIRAIYNYKERGMEVLVYKSAVDTRNGSDSCVIESRTGFTVDGRWLPKDESIYHMIAEDAICTLDHIKAIFVDECQFLSEAQVDELQLICYNFNIPILCYGLKVDFQRHLFPGSKRLLEIADSVQELIGICHCGAKAMQNARVVNGIMAKDGDIVKIGNSDTDGKEDEIYYTALCNQCYINGRIN
jgi:thymidine kinase